MTCDKMLIKWSLKYDFLFENIFSDPIFVFIFIFLLLGSFRLLKRNVFNM